MLDHGPESKQSQQPVIGVRGMSYRYSFVPNNLSERWRWLPPPRGTLLFSGACQRRFDCGVMPAVRALHRRDPYIGVPADAPVGVDEFRRAKSGGDAVCHCEDDAAAL